MPASLRILLSVLVLAAVGPATVSFAQDVPAAPPSTDVTTSDFSGLRRALGAAGLSVGGTIMLDWGAFTDARDGAEVRRAELKLEGEPIDGLEFEIEFDFSGGDPNFTDFLVKTQHFTAGILKEPFGLEILTSSKYTTFLERSLLQSLTPPRSMGVMYRDWLESGNGTLAVGVFRERDTFEGSDEFGDYMITGRATARIPHAEGAFTHVGLALSQREADADDTLRIKQRPEVHQLPSLLDTGNFMGDELQILGLECASVHGPLSLQGEVVRTIVDPSPGQEAHFDGVYAYVSYFLTGESRPYDTRNAKFGRIHPNTDYAVGSGAWELAARYSRLDLTDAGFAGGELDNVTLGINWYLSSHTRVMANYVHGWLAGAGTIDAAMLRIQFDI